MVAMALLLSATTLCKHCFKFSFFCMNTKIKKIKRNTKNIYQLKKTIKTNIKNLQSAIW